jgi:hypothetical protein
MHTDHKIIIAAIPFPKAVSFRSRGLNVLIVERFAGEVVVSLPIRRISQQPNLNHNGVVGLS